eukprot:TRINITY_DN4709_c0_g1_i2.p1 TRINITY_DN4709_c0_g1~~TRINITY_DN4709_c0_g1_i2.p1  ORF type:complete len:368 (-),score=51.12 TRINITY_DN4709_c0_g1_i2:157-1260(-)
MDKDGQPMMRQRMMTTPQGTVKLVTTARGKVDVCVQPTGDPAPAPLYLSLQNGQEFSSRIRGEHFTGAHVQLLAQILGSEEAAVRQVLLDDFEGLAALHWPSPGELWHVHLKQKDAVYSRRNMAFLKAPEFERDKIEGVARQLSDHFGFDDGVAIQQNLSSAKIQAEVERLIRNGDQQGLVVYVRSFMDVTIPKEFEEVPGMAEKWHGAKEDQARAIVTQLQFLVERGWSQMSDTSVAQTAHTLMKLMSESVHKLWVEDGAESLIDNAISADTPLMLEHGASESAYRIVEQDGKFRSLVNKAAMGNIHEGHVKKILVRCGYDIVEAKLPGNTGIDILAVKRNERGDICASLWLSARQRVRRIRMCRR